MRTITFDSLTLPRELAEDDGAVGVEGSLDLIALGDVDHILGKRDDKEKLTGLFVKLCFVRTLLTGGNRLDTTSPTGTTGGVEGIEVSDKRLGIETGNGVNVLDSLGDQLARILVVLGESLDTAHASGKEGFENEVRGEVGTLGHSRAFRLSASGAVFVCCAIIITDQITIVKLLVAAGVMCITS